MVAGESATSLLIERTSSCAARRNSSSALSRGIFEALSFSVRPSSSLSTSSLVVILLTVTLRFQNSVVSIFSAGQLPLVYSIRSLV
jgi:hypothetical protein